MKPIMFVLFVIVIQLISCKEKEKTTGKEAAELVRDPAKDSSEIRTVITDFYNWYNKNYPKFQEYDLCSGIKKKDAPPYKINWVEVQKYQDFIRTSVPQLGEEFVKNQKYFFQQCDSAFKVDVEDDIPYGFDYDWYSNSQEDPQYLVDQVNDHGPWAIIVKDNDALAEIKGFNDHNGKQERVTILSITMKKEHGKWTIARIGSDN